jgi:iron complex transport system ATP-binding protein
VIGMNKPVPALVVSDVTLTRDTRRILDGVSLEVKPGCLLAVIGPNGAGKSSLLSVMSGLWKADHGSVRLEGRMIGEYASADRARRCAVMRQDNTRPAGMTVLEVVELGRLAHGAGGDTRVLSWEMLRRMDLEDLAARDCARLSGGEWQRVAFARTVAQLASPQRHGVLLLDEPVSSLDPAHQHQLLGEARRLAGDGYAVLAILHDLNLTAQYADEVALLAGGRMHACGPVADIMQPHVLSGIYGCRVVEVRDGGQRALVSLPPETVP